MFKRFLSTVSGVVAAILPAAACPACVPAYASALSSLGVNFLGFGTGQFALVGILLSVALGMLAYDCKRHRRIGPLIIGLLGCACVVTSRIYFDQPLVSYAGSTAFLSAAIWNGLIVKKQRTLTKHTNHHCPCGQEDK